MKIDREREDLIEARKDIRRSVKATLDSVRTIKGLLAAWPESSELIPSDLSSVISTLPSVVVDDLNKLIGLPSSK